MAQQVLQGECELCGQVIAKSGMSTHLRRCRRDHPQPAEGGDAKAKKQAVFHLIVEGEHAPQYWLHLDVAGSARLGDLDNFLREIWVECCDHLSAFTIEGRQYVDPPQWAEEESFYVRVKRVLHPKLVFKYEYDFGSTTTLKIRVVAQNEDRIPTERVTLLARNLPPDYHCDRCGQPARQVCCECYYSVGAWLCDACAEQHECGEDRLLPVVNSPRVGVCGYCG